MGQQGNKIWKTEGGEGEEEGGREGGGGHGDR